METRLPSICVECGLCCDGTLYSDVVFGRDGNDPNIKKEQKRFKTLEFTAAHHDKEPAWRAPLHPCEFLGSDNCCEIYEDRPSICSAHDCWLLLEYNAGFKTYGFAVNEINRIKALQDELRLKGLTQSQIGSEIRKMQELDAFYGNTEKYEYMEKRLAKKKQKKG